MTRSFVNSLMFTPVAVALAALVSFDLNAQQNESRLKAQTGSRVEQTTPLPTGGPAPHMADGRPDLSGHWFVGSLGKENALLGASGATAGDPNVRAFDPKVTPEEKPSFQPSVVEKLKEDGAYTAGVSADNDSAYARLSKAQQLAAVNAELINLQRNCMPRGVPDIFLGGAHGITLVQSPTYLVQLNELNHDYRLIPLDGRPHTKDPDPQFNGDETTHWDGDTLVIDTIAVDERVWNSSVWRIHSDQEHVVERIWRPSMNYLDYQVTIEDPKVLTKPWKSVVHHFSLSHEPAIEWYCGLISPDDDVTVQALHKRKAQLELELKQQN
jgi:hypothetical protein